MPPCQGGCREFESRRPLQLLFINWQRTFVNKPATLESKRVVVDGADQTVGRLASNVAKVLLGKNKVNYSPDCDNGDYVVVINSDKVRFTGKKESDKIYYHHTGFIGGIKSATAREMREKHPDRIITNAVKGMLPRGPLGYQILKKLRVYAGSEHPHMAQNPTTMTFSN